MRTGDFFFFFANSNTLFAAKCIAQLLTECRSRTSSRFKFRYNCCNYKNISNYQNSNKLFYLSTCNRKQKEEYSSIYEVSNTYRSYSVFSHIEDTWLVLSVHYDEQKMLLSWVSHYWYLKWNVFFLKDAYVTFWLSIASKHFLKQKRKRWT